MLFAVLLLLAGCTPEPEPIVYGEVECAYCRMTVTDPRYGSELVTATGKTFMFDAIECLAAYVEENADLHVHSLWVPNFRNPGTLLHIDDVFFVQSNQLKSPMALNLAAFARAHATPEAVRDSLDGTIMDWTEVRDLVRRRWIENPEKGPGHAMPMEPTSH